MANLSGPDTRPKIINSLVSVGEKERSGCPGQGFGQAPLIVISILKFVKNDQGKEVSNPRAQTSAFFDQSCRTVSKKVETYITFFVEKPPALGAPVSIKPNSPTAFNTGSNHIERHAAQSSTVTIQDIPKNP